MIKKYAFTVKEEVMSANNKTLGQLQELLGVLSHYGVVADYDADRKAENAEYQASIDGLKSQLETLKADPRISVTADELEIIKVCRLNVAKHEADKDKVIAEYQTAVTKLEDTLSQFKTKLRTMADE